MLKWRRELPKEAGYYWYKRDGGGSIALVFMDGIRMCVYMGAENPVPVEKFGRQGYNGPIFWAGPIEKPMD